MSRRDTGSMRRGRGWFAHPAPRVGRWGLVLGLMLAAAVLLPIAASGYLATGPTADRNWFWQNPLPQGNDLKAADWISSSTGWAVGVAGTALKTTDGGTTWTALDPHTTNDLSGVDFLDANNGWVTGLSGTMLHTTDGGSTWVTQAVPTMPAGRNLRAVSFWSATVGVAVGDLGTSTSTILYTSDGGTTWKTASATSTVGLTSVQMVSATTGWAVGGAGVLLKTTNGGATWTPQASPTVAGLSSISFASGGTVGYMVGNAVLPNWTIYKTANGGATWTAVNGLGATGAINLTSVSCLDANNAVTVGTNGQIRHTTDGGTTWSNQSQNNVGANALRSVKMIDANTIKTVGDLGMTYSTDDSGNFWATPMPAVTSTFQNCCFVDASHGWAVGSNGTVLKTADGGLTWTVQASGITVWRGVYFTNVNNGWIVGDGGAIRHTTDGGVTWVAQTSNTTQQLNSVHFTSATTGAAVGAGGAVVRTTNSGSTWTVRSSGTTNNLNATWFATGSTTGWAVGDGGVVLKSTNTGRTWTAQTSGTTQNLLCVKGVSTTAAWAAGNNSTMIKTTNGTAWSALAPGAGTNPIRTVFFASSTTGWYGSNYGIVKKTTDGGTTWTQENAGLPTSASDPPTGLWGSWFVDASTGYLVGDSGTVRKTTDGGATWASQQYSTQNALNAVGFANGQNGWVSGSGGFMLHTGDGGQTWSAEKTGSNSAMNAMSMTTTSTGWAVGDNGAVRRSTNGGLTWSGVSAGVNVNLAAVSTFDGTHTVIGGQGALKYTNDAGSTWTTATTPPGQPITGLSMVSATEGFATSTRVSGNNVVWHTTDGGATWASQATPTNANFWAVCFVNPTTGFVCGDSGSILKTTNGGGSWVAQSTPTGQAFYAIDFYDATHGIAVGANGVIARTSDGGATWSLQSSGTNRTLTGVGWATGNLAFISGNFGTILRSGNLSGPTTSMFMTPSSPDGTNGWYKSDPAIQLLSDRPGTTYYGWASSAGPFSIYTGSFLATQGASTLYFYSVDTSSNAEAVKSASTLVDFGDPTPSSLVTISAITTSSAQADWLDGTDTLSGIDHYDVYLNGTYSASTSDESTSVALSGLLPKTQYVARVVSVDQAGNESSASVPATFTTADNTPLTTTATPTPLSPDGLNGWYVTTPTVTLVASPTVPSTTRFAWDSSALASYTVPVAMPSGGTHTLSFWSIDNARFRDQESTKTLTLKFDNSSPVAPSTIAASGASTSSVAVSWSGASDAQSGIDHFDLWVGGSRYGTYTGTAAIVTGLTVNSSYPVYVVTVNSAGLSSVSSTVIGHTLSNPAVSTSVTVTPSAPDGLSGWYTSAPSIALASQPSTVPAWTYYGFDGSAATTYAGPIGLPSEGTHTLRYASVDRSDSSNRESTQTLNLKRDTVAPSAPASVTAVSADTTTVALAWTLGSDATSGLDHYQLYLDGAPLKSVAGTSTTVSGLTPNTLHSFSVASVDVAGNTGSPSTAVWAATNALPALVTSALASPASPDGANSWYVTTPTVSFSVSPPVSAWTYYAWDGSALATASGSVPIPSLGTHTLAFRSVDQAHLRADEATRQLTYRLDTSSPSSPTVTVSASSPTSLAVSWTAVSDAQSGIDHFALYLDGSLSATYPASASGASAGGLGVNSSHSVRVDAVNGAGLSASSAVVSATTLSNTAVYSIAYPSPSAPDGANGWYVTVPSFTLAAMPPSVTTAQAYFGWDGAALATYTVPVSPGADGVHTLAYLSADTADATNRETTRTLVVSVDTVAPSAPASISAQTLSATSVGVAWTLGADSTSGVDHYDLYLDGTLQGSYSATGTTVSGLTPNSLHTFYVKTIDEAGNASASSPSVLGAAAASAPLVTAANPSPSSPSGEGGWYVSAPEITFSVTPPVSATTFYGWDGSAMATATGSVTAPSDGTHTLFYWSIDTAHQHAPETTQEVAFKVDSASPTAPGSVMASGITTNSLAVTWSAASDAGSGVDHYQVFVDGAGSVVTSTTSAVVSGLAVNSTHLVRVVAFDAAGLFATSGDVSGTTLQNPAISTLRTISPTAPDGAGGWYVTTPTVTLSTLPWDLAATTHCAWDGGSLSTYSSSLTMLAEGTHTLRYWSEDDVDATNRDTTTTDSFKLDATPPTPPIAMLATTLDTTSVAVSWGAGSDAVSGLDHYDLYVDGAPQGSYTSTGTTVTGLSVNAIHTFYVVSVDAAGNISAQSPSAIAVTGALAPLTTLASVTPVTPDGLSGWYVTTPTVSFSVVQPVLADTYYAWDAAAFTLAAGPIAPQSSGVHTLSFYSVDSAHEHTPETPQQITLSIDTAPDLKANPASASPTPSIAATSTFTTSNSTNLTWTPATPPPSGLDHYEVWDEYVGSTSGTSYLVSGLTPLRTYNFVVYGVSGAGTYFSESNTATVDTSASPVPAAPGVVAARAPSEGYAYVNWLPSTDAFGGVSYRVWRSGDGVTFSAVATTTDGLLGTSYIDRGLGSSRRYWYAVSTIDDRGESLLSDVSTPTWPYIAPVTGPPARVQGLTEQGSDSTVFLQWQPSSDPSIAAYYVLRAPRSLSATATTLTPIPIAANGYFDTSAVNGEPYYYSIVAVDASGTLGRPSLEIEGKAQRTYGDELEPHSYGNESPTSCICHAIHTGQDDKLIRFPGATARTVCETCHPPANSLGEFLDPLAVSRHAQGSEVTTSTPFTCNTCHVPVRHSNEATGSLLRVNGSWTCTDVTGTPPGDGFCYTCHGAGSTLPQGDLTGFEQSAHANVSAPPTGANVKCDTCHESHSSRNEDLNRYSGFMMCMQCHSASASDPNEPDIWSKLEMDEDANAKHPMLPQDQANGARMSCQNCHNTHSVRSINPLVNPHNPSPSGTWTTPLTDEKDYCFTCHNGQPLPTSAETTPWASAVLASNGATTVTNIQSAYSTNVHGFGQRSNSATTTAFLRPDMGYTEGTVLECRSCHDAHGTANNYALVQNVVSANGGKTINAAIVVPTGTGGYDLRFFCSSCHLWDSSTHDSMANTSTVSFPTDCTACHRHVRANGNPSNNL